MGNKVPWKTGMLIYLPVTSRPLIFLLLKGAVLSPCNFATARLTACILNFLSPLNFATHEMEDAYATPQLLWGAGKVCHPTSLAQVSKQPKRPKLLINVGRNQDANGVFGKRGFAPSKIHLSIWCCREQARMSLPLQRSKLRTLEMAPSPAKTP